VRWALDWTGLESRGMDRVGGYSGGMRRRLNIACGVLHRPRLVLLDEPTVGVDPQARERIFRMLEELRAEGAALVQSTHELGDIEGHCDRLLVMDHGRAVAAGTPESLVRETVGDRARVELELDKDPGMEITPELRASGRVLGGDLSEPARDLPRILEQVAAAGCRVVRLEVKRPGLAEVFVALTGRELRE
jgi:ABC-2 type transport system ATP-binding protein